MNFIRQAWQRITRTRYTRELEIEITRQRAEIDRLRAENRALLNSILGIAGIPPLPHFSHSHSESARADDESVSRTPPPAAPADGTAGARAAGNNSLGGHLPTGPSSHPRNDSLHSAAGNVAQVFRPEGVPENDAAKSLGSEDPSYMSNRGAAHSSTPAQHKLRPIAPPHRRRSWHQINRILELESARKQSVTGDS